MEYNFHMRTGALNDAANAPPAARGPQAPAPSSLGLASAELFEGDDYATAHATGVNMMPVAAAAVHARSRSRATLARRPPERPQDTSGLDPITIRAGGGMFFYTVQDGQRVRAIDEDGRVVIVAGPKRIYR